MNSYESNAQQTLFFIMMALVLIAFTALVELALRRVSHHHIIALEGERPTSEKLTYWAEINPHWGIWHVSGGSMRHKKSCFDVRYQANSYGARDSERTEQSSASRLVVLGDSFVEGVGVNDAARFTNLLEQDTQFEHLNFGTSGGFGSIQEWQVYEHLASKFQHQAVLIFFLPDNDFKDNRFDPDNERYRPLLRKLPEKSYELYYSKKQSHPEPRQLSSPEVIYNKIYNRLYIVRMFHYLGTKLMNRLQHKHSKKHQAHIHTIGYRDYTAEDLAQLFYSYQKIIALADKKPVYIYMIPRQADVQLLDKQTYESLALPAAMQAFAATYPHVTFVDMLPYFRAAAATNKQGFKSYFHGCDGHWNAAGHMLVAGIVKTTAKSLYKKP